MSSSIYFEDDIQFHNQLLSQVCKARESRTVPDYSLNKTLEAVDAIAELIKVKAMKQSQMILNQNAYTNKEDKDSF